VVVEDVMETDNNDEELSSERERERRRKVHWEREREPEVEMHGGKRSLIRFVRGTILRVCSLSLLKRPTLGVRRKRHFMSGCTSREYGRRREREIGRKERERERERSEEEEPLCRSGRLGHSRRCRIGEMPNRNRQGGESEKVV
jgi:hypothetical protein